MELEAIQKSVLFRMLAVILDERKCVCSILSKSGTSRECSFCHLMADVKKGFPETYFAAVEYHALKERF